MKKALDLIYERFLELEANEWGDGEVAAIRQYSWGTWYRPSRLQFSRLVAEYLSNECACAGGLPLLEAKLQAVLANVEDLDQLRPKKGFVTRSIPSPHLRAEPTLGQITCDLSSRSRVADVVRADFPYGARVAMLGDDDLISLALADSNYPSVVFDIDSRLEAILEEESNIEYVHHDIRSPIPLEKQFDAVILDPADGSVALTFWLRRANECLSGEEGARVYLSINPWRLGRRWVSVIDECSKYDLIPCGSRQRIKVYPKPNSIPTVTDLWIFERVVLPSYLPHPYLDIEVFR